MSDTKKLIFNENIISKTKEKFCFPDSINNRNNIKGFVELYDKETGENIIKKQNLIVYESREIILQRMVNRNRVTNSGEKDLFINWISIGSGGALVTDPLNPIAPTLFDTGLVNQIVIDATNTSYTSSGKLKPFDAIDILQDEANDDRYLIAKITTTIARSEANVNDINEAALWLTNSSDPVNATLNKLFSRVTFSTVRKDDNRELVLVWYLFF